MYLYGMMKERGVAASTNTLIILMEGFCAFGGLHYAIQVSRSIWVYAFYHFP